MSLLTLAAEFRLGFDDVQKILGDNLQARYRGKSASLDRTEETAKKLIAEWTKGKTPASSAPTFEKDEAVLKRANMIKSSVKIAGALAFILTPVAIFTTAAAGAIFFGHVFVRAALTGTSFALSSMAFLQTVGMISSFSSVISGIGVLVLNRSETLRKKRVIIDINFQDFIGKHLVNAEEGSRFLPTSKHLADRKLHEIYLQWKDSLKCILD